MDPEVDIRELAALVQAKRGRRGLRTVAQEIGGVSASTLSRIEQGKVPDLDTFARLCRWLGVSPERFLPGTSEQEGAVSSAELPSGTSREAVITAHLRADRTLDPATADALATVIRLAYDAVSQGKLTGNADAGERSAGRVQDVG